MTDKNKKNEKSMEGLAYGMKMELARAKSNYIKHTINGRYFLARCNMIASQLIENKIKEKIDGCIKTKEYMKAEYALTKMQAINEMRNAHFAKEELVEKHKLTEDNIYAIEEDYYNGKIIREEYDDAYKKGKEAKFVDTSKN